MSNRAHKTFGHEKFLLLAAPQRLHKLLPVQLPLAASCEQDTDEVVVVALAAVEENLTASQRKTTITAGRTRTKRTCI